jgi:putative tryptophan/tyrosine transport system substrate-binding protein
MRLIGLAVVLTLSLLAALPEPEAQQASKIARIGFLGATSASSWTSRVEAFRVGLSDLGYVEGRNITIEFRWAEGQYSRLPDLAAELVRLKVDLLVTHGTPGTLAAKQATTTTPIVMAASGDAVAAGLVAGLARPGGNVTGSTYFVRELMVKRLELLKDAMPRITRVAVLVKPDNPFFVQLRDLEISANALKLALQQVAAPGPNEFEAAFSAMAKSRVDAVLISEDAAFVTHVRALTDLAAKHRLLSAGFGELAQAGGLIGYGVNFPELYRRAAVFVDKILKGAKPADIPVERATTFELVLNLKTAKALGLTIPQSLLVRANEIIQ